MHHRPGQPPRTQTTNDKGLITISTSADNNYDYATDPDNRLELVEVVITQDPDPTSRFYQEEEVDVIIGDGVAVFDEDFDFDARVYFYFDNREQFERAKRELIEEVGFVILREVDDTDTDTDTGGDEPPAPGRPTNQRVRIGTCAVDSGQIMVVDPCYLDEYKADDFDPDTAKLNDFSYSGACATTLTSLGAGQIRTMTAVVASSGYGDGLYPVYATYDHEGTITKLEIEFVWDDEDGEDD